MDELITKKSAVSAFTDLLIWKLKGERLPTWNDVYNAINAIPSAQQEPNTGRWIDDNCSECGQYVFHGDARNFCPNCGTKMENDL